ncbi:MAG TPA: S1/P1 nuclease [Caldimonas sp.]|nr:S1/P1 nuclease [Caldimonas sp.]
MRRLSAALALALWLLLLPSPAVAWGPDGHHSVGAIADRLIAGSNAALQVSSLLGGLSLEDAAVWADCAKGIDPKQGYRYTSEGQYPECAIFENPAEEAAMADYVRRNDTNCNPKPGEESCHKQYHYADIAIEHDHYDSGFVGAREDDIVHAVIAMTIVLQGGPAPAPFNIKDKREALLLLAHYVGDVHQPLHVGAVYLNASGQRVDPDSGTFSPATETRGGNQLLIDGNAHRKLHAAWDAVPASLKPAKVDSVLGPAARAVRASSGSVPDWPAEWATETQQEAQRAFTGLTFGRKVNSTWSVKLPARYNAKATQIKTPQIEKAGARLAELLHALWP